MTTGSTKPEEPAKVWFKFLQTTVGAALEPGMFIILKSVNE